MSKYQQGKAPAVAYKNGIIAWKFDNDQYLTHSNESPSYRGDRRRG